MKPEEVLITSVTNSRQTGHVIIPIINVYWKKEYVIVLVRSK